MRKYLLLAAVALPIVALFGVMLAKQLRLSGGAEVVLPITGFDPRDLLAGHYLTYRINYGAAPDCYGSQARGRALCACLYKTAPADEFYRARFVPLDEMTDSECPLFIAGRCDGDRFAAGIEKFFVPEQYAAPLDRAVRAGRGKIVLKVSYDGSAAIKDLLIDGKSWREYKK